MVRAARLAGLCRLPRRQGRWQRAPAGQRPPARREVTLQSPRPDQLRAFNIYSTTPSASGERADDGRGRRAAASHGKPGADCGWRGEPAPTKPVSRQPVPLKPPPPPADEPEPILRDSFVCAACGRCRCEACREPRPLPQHLLCGQKCVLSAETCVDCVSCLCCVKALSYHCSSSDSGSRDADKPCSCGAGNAACCLRWSALGLLSAVLPCLWCYWPLRGGVKLLEKCYQRRTGAGCTCPATSLLQR